MSIPHVEDFEECDWQYQIYSPVEYRPKRSKEKSLVFLVTELGVDPNDHRIAPFNLTFFDLAYGCKFIACNSIDTNPFT